MAGCSVLNDEPDELINYEMRMCGYLRERECVATANRVHEHSITTNRPLGFCLRDLMCRNARRAWFPGEQSHQNRAYYQAWFVWWFRFGSGRGERSRLESRLNRSTGSDGWLDSGGPLPTVRCLQGGRKLVDNTNQGPCFRFVLT
jgi:hypothetical protein